MHVLGDIHGIADRVREIDPLLRIRWDARRCRYQVVRLERRMRYEGRLSGAPLYSMTDYDWPILTVPRLDVRVLRRLREIDTWAHGGGAVLAKRMQEGEQASRARLEARTDDHIETVTRDRAKYIQREYDNEDLRTVWQVAKPAAAEVG